jgi:hypothetical protein
VADGGGGGCHLAAVTLAFLSTVVVLVATSVPWHCFLLGGRSSSVVGHGWGCRVIGGVLKPIINLS